MTVEEIKAKLPEAEVYALSPDFKYIVICDRNVISKNQLINFMQSAHDQGFPNMMFLHTDTSIVDAMSILEIK